MKEDGKYFYCLSSIHIGKYDLWIHLKTFKKQGCISVDCQPPAHHQSVLHSEQV